MAGAGGELTDRRFARGPGMHRTIWLAAFVAFALACLGFWGLSVWQDRAATLRDATVRAAAVADLLREHAARAIEAGDHIVRTLAYLAAAWDLRDEEAGRRIWEEIRERVADSPQTASAWIVDAKGDAVLDTWDYPSKAGNFAHRDYHRAQLGAERGLFIGAADRGTTSGRPRFTLSRAIRAGDGGLEGVAVAGVYSDYFAKVYGEAGLAPGAVLALLTADGDVLAEWPIDEIPAAEELSLPALLERQATASGGAFTAEGAGEARLIAYRTLADRPLIVAVSTPVAGALAEWRARTWRSGALAFAGLGGFAILVATGVAAARREAAVIAESEARYRDLFEGSNDAILLADAATGRYVDGNRRAEELTGYSREELFTKSVGQMTTAGTRARSDELIRGLRERGSLRGEVEVLAKDGRVVPVEVSGRTVTAGGCALVQLVARDITERRRAEEQRELLLAELNHRIKNAFTLVQAIALQTLRHSADLGEFERAFLGRLDALARVSGHLAADDGQGADLRALAEAVVERPTGATTAARTCAAPTWRCRRRPPAR